jgi:hypothetical protein
MLATRTIPGDAMPSMCVSTLADFEFKVEL